MSLFPRVSVSPGAFVVLARSAPSLSKAESWAAAQHAATARRAQEVCADATMELRTKEERLIKSIIKNCINSPNKFPSIIKSIRKNVNDQKKTTGCFLQTKKDR